MSYTYDFYRNTCNNLKSHGFYPKRILDIGASVGLTAKINKECWPNAEMLVIEGNEECATYLKQFNCLFKLLGKENGVVNFYKSKQDPYGTGNSIYREISDSYEEKDLIIEKRNIYRLDDCVNETYDFIKIDTQGSELDIIEGGINTIKNAKVIIIEVSLMETNEGGCLKPDVVKKLISLGFDFITTIELIHNGKVINQENLLFIKPN